MVNSGDQAAGFGPLPDHVPDELVDRYGRQAHKSVRHSRSRRRRLGRSLGKASVSLKDGDVLSTAAVIFMWGVAAVAFVVGMAYILMLWPKAGVAMVGTLLILTGVSLGGALRMAKKRKAAEEALFS